MRGEWAEKTAVTKMATKGDRALTFLSILAQISPKMEFFQGVGTGDLSKSDKILISVFFDIGLFFSLVRLTRELGVPKTSLGNDFYVKITN